MRGRPGRTAIPVLALGFVLMLFSAGVAVAGPGGPGAARGDEHGQGWHTDGDNSNNGADHGSDNGADHGWQADEHEHGNGHGNGQGDDGPGNDGPGGGSGGGVGGQSDGGTDTPTVPVPTVPPVPALPSVVPAVPSVVVPTPAVEFAPQVEAAAVTVDGTDVPADTTAALPDLSGLAALGDVATPPAAAGGGLLPAARDVLSTPEARSLAAVLAIALAVLLFLAMQGLLDRGEPKLAGVRDDRDVARFR